jgi:hypothetical protein
MKPKNRFFILQLIILIFIPAISGAQPEIKVWEIFDISLKSAKKFQNPYMETVKDGEDPYFSAIFTGQSGDALNQSIRVPGFWDGDNLWKIRFAPPADGIWKYTTISNDSGLKGKTGVVIVSDWSEEEKKANPIRRGFINVNGSGERAGRYFTYADGTPFLWIADTWWDWTNRRITFESFKRLVDTRAEQGYNIGQIFFAGNGWSRESSLLDPAFQIPDLEQIRNVEIMIAYANSKGITVWIHPWWSNEKINEKIGAENIRRWWRYVIHRLCAYNVIWVLAGEYNMHNYGGFALNFWNDLGNLVKSEDPYDRILGAHPTAPMWSGGAEAPQWSTSEAVHREQWVDYNQSQTGHARWRNELIPWIVANAYAKKPAKPVVVTEPWYEFIEGNPTAMDIRFASWSAVMSGAAGHSYGGGHTWRAHLPERPKVVGTWPMDTSFDVNTLGYPGAVSVGFMGRYLRKLEWWKLEPHPELVSENPSHYCLADPGREYLFFLRYGGSVKLDLREFPEPREFFYQWTDLVKSQDSRSGTIKGGRIAEIKCPEDYPNVVNFKDWILQIKLHP